MCSCQGVRKAGKHLTGNWKSDRMPKRRGKQGWPKDCFNRTCITSSQFPVVMTKGSHLFPYRTQQLSPSVPMVLGWRRPGRVGRCRNPFRRSCKTSSFFVVMGARRATTGRPYRVRRQTRKHLPALCCQEVFSLCRA